MRPNSLLAVGPTRIRCAKTKVTGCFGEWGIPKDSPAERQRLERALEERLGLEECEEFKPIRRG